MKTIAAFLLCVSLPILQHGQAPNGEPPATRHPQSVKPHAQAAEASPPSATYALVVGISDYQDPGIPDLKFAHRDALHFADWLQRPAGGSVPADNITLLTNEQATHSAITLALYNFLDIAASGDQVIFYFAGHGDVEAKVSRQPGYLLGHDSPAKVYALGSVRLGDIQDVVATLSEKNVRVLLVTNACHAGKLAGESEGGAQSTALALRKQFAAEVKIMSCQPDEFSLEGAQWGGGRGVFSYHLLDGLTGLADRDGDGQVTLFEIGRYLEDLVPAEAAPHPQMPLTLGDRNTRLAVVHSPSLAELQATKDRGKATLAQSDSRGIEDEVLARVDDATRWRYFSFKRALERDDLLADADSSANTLFGQLIAEEALKPLHGLMRRNFAVALLDEVQQAMNALMESDPYEVNHWHYNPSKYAQYPPYLQRTLELLGAGHPMATSIRVKQYFFEAYLLSKSLNEDLSEQQRNLVLNQSKQRFQEAIELDPDAPFLYHAMAGLYMNYEQMDSMAWYINRALELSPAWLLPYMDYAQGLLWVMASPEQAIAWLNKGLAIDSNSYVLLERLAWANQNANHYTKAIPICEKMIRLRPEIGNGYATLGYSYIALQEYERAIPYVQKGMELNPAALWWSGTDYGRILNRMRRFREGRAHLEQLLRSPNAQFMDKVIISEELLFASLDQQMPDSVEALARRILQFNVFPATLVGAKTMLGRMALERDDLQESERLLLEALDEDPTYNALDDMAHACLGRVYERKGDLSAAETHWAAISGKYVRNMTYPFYDEAVFQKGRFRMRHGRNNEAVQIFQTLAADSPTGYRGWYGLALIAAQQGDKQAALDNLEKALDRYYPVPGPILEEPLFKAIRKTKRFNAMMAQHFP